MTDQGFPVDLPAPVALVLTGGGARGAAQAGAAVALIERGLRPDLIVGTSAGAWNAAWLALHPDRPRDLLGLWRDPEVTRFLSGLRRRSVAALLTRRRSVCPNRPMRRLLARALGTRRFADAPVPLVVQASDLGTGEHVLLESGSLVDAVLASSAIPLLLPPVRIGRRTLVDGGVTDGYGIEAALTHGARSIVMLDTATAPLEGTPRGFTATMDRVAEMTRSRQYRHSLELAAAAGVPVRILPLLPVCGTLGFRHAAESIEDGYTLAERWVDGGMRVQPAPAQGSVSAPASRPARRWRETVQAAVRLSRTFRSDPARARRGAPAPVLIAEALAAVVRDAAD